MMTRTFYLFNLQKKKIVSNAFYIFDVMTEQHEGLTGKLMFLTVHTDKGYYKCIYQLDFHSNLSIFWGEIYFKMLGITM